MVDTTWTITNLADEITADGMTIDGGWPDFTVGSEVSFSLVFESQHASSYQTMREYGKYLFDDAVEYGTDYREVPYYKERINPDFRPSASVSFLFKLLPADRIRNLKGWWIIVSDIEDATLYDGPWGRLNFTGFVLAPASEGDRSYIENQFEVT